MKINIQLRKYSSLLFLFTSLFFVALSSQAQDAKLDEWHALTAEAQALESEINRLEAKNEVEKLQRIFGYYFDKQLWSQAADLFADNGTVELGGDGVYVGKERILQYFNTMGAEGPQEGVLNDHMQLQAVVHVISPNRAKGRWHHFSQQAVHGENHFWGTGTYENEYVKEDGVWKIEKLHLYSTMRTPYDQGWAKQALPRSTPSATLPPDQPPSVDYENYPAVFVPPYHYDNPVTGHNEVTTEPDVRDLTKQEFTSLLSDLEHRAGLLQDVQEIDRLHVIYGYYLARNQWDDLAGIFANDGSIEIAMRGVYRGHPSIRRNLNLYGVQGELKGQLHNHMQFQAVIDVSDDGQTAQMRSRAFSMLGTYHKNATWMAGVYENIFVKRDGVWQLYKDQVFNTYFAVYGEGWKNLDRRNPPGITEDNPPDEPPTLPFEMYPSAFLPPFHYVNPATGK